MPDLFKDWITSINEKHVNVFKEGSVNELEMDYPSYMINRALSQSKDTIQYANLINIKAEYMAPKMQYDFLFHAVPKRKRFEKWAKSEKLDDIEVIKKVFGYSQKKAEIARDLMTDADVEELKKHNFEGGK